MTRKIKSPLTTHDKENDSFVCFFFFFPENQTRAKEKLGQRSAVSTVGAVVSQPAFARARVCTRRGRGARGPRFPSLAGFHLGPCSFVEIPEHKQPMCETHSPPSSWAESRLGGAAWASQSRSSGCPGVPWGACSRLAANECGKHSRPAFLCWKICREVLVGSHSVRSKRHPAESAPGQGE